MSKVTFDGPNKLININPGVDTLDVQIDLYSEWKRWAVLDINLKFDQAFRTFGGDQTISGQFAPRYFFLTNGWRIVIDSGVDLLVGTNLYTDELDSPFIVTNDSTVSLNNSDAAVVDSGIAESLDYGGVVIINTTTGIEGTNYPIGTIFQPSNNLHDAKIIAQRYGFHSYNVFGTVIFDEDLENSTVFGGNIRDIVVFQNVNVDGTTFKECVLAGVYQGSIAGETVQLADGLTGASGVFKDSGILGNIHCSPNTNLSLLNCSAMVHGTNSPSIHMDTDVSLSLRKYSGGMAVYNCSSGSVATLEFLAGNCRLLTGNTGGQIVIRGMTTLTDESEGTEVLIDGLITPNQKVFGGSIG